MKAINDLAIALTKKLEPAIIERFVNNKESPSYYNIRQMLFEELSKYIKIGHVELKESPMMLKQMEDPARKDWLRHQTEKQAFEIAKMALNENLVDRFEWKDEWDLYRSIHTTIAFIDLKEVKENSQTKKDKPCPKT